MCSVPTRRPLPNCKKAGPTRCPVLDGERNSFPTSVYYIVWKSPLRRLLTVPASRGQPEDRDRSRQRLGCEQLTGRVVIARGKSGHTRSGRQAGFDASLSSVMRRLPPICLLVDRECFATLSDNVSRH